MKAIVQNDYGSPDVCELRDIDKPVVKDGDVRVRVHAAGLNAGDVFSMRGDPWASRLSVGFPKPKNHVPGWDLAGHVERVGKNVTRFQPGDEVFGSCRGACAEYACAAEEELTIKSDDITFEQSAAVPTAGVTTLQGLRDYGKAGAGHKVLINGASGDMGTALLEHRGNGGKRVLVTGV